MPSNLFDQATKQDRTYTGMSWTWTGDSCTYVTTQSASSARTQTCFTGDITNTPFEAGKSYVIEYTASVVQLYIYYYTDAALTTLISSFYTLTDTTTTIPSNCGGILIRLRVPANTLPNETVTPVIYIGTTDLDADLKSMEEAVGRYNSTFYSDWDKFANPPPWDGESCSEIACCISYLAGNLSKIYVSNYAQGLIDLYRANGRYGTTPALGAFIWFDYDHDGIGDHTGRVYSISGDQIITVEGNVYSTVAYFPYSVHDSTILGYGYPNYDGGIIVDPDAPQPTIKTYVPYFRHMKALRRNS